MGVVQMSRGVLTPASADLLSEVEIIARIAAAMDGAVSPVPWLWLAEDYDRIRSHDQFNTTIYGMDDRYRGISKARRIILVNPEDPRERGGAAVFSGGYHQHLGR